MNRAAVAGVYEVLCRVCRHGKRGIPPPNAYKFTRRTGSHEVCHWQGLCWYARCR